jgi:uncharacterized protein YcbX
MRTTIGSVAALRRYPVKSMQGEELDAAEISARGILGDRAYAILDRATGFIASAKHPRKWSTLFACRAAFVEAPLPGAPLPPIWITLPDGSVITSGQKDVDRILSRVLDREVALVAEVAAAPIREADRSSIEQLASGSTIREEPMALAAPPGTFFDYAVLHILTTATIERLRELHPAGRVEIQRLRPNIVVAPAGDERGFVENAWLGQMLAIGAQAQVHVIDPCPRCVVTTLAQGELPRDPGILRTLGQHNAAASVTLAPGVVFSAVAGVYASVLRGGALCRGDAIASIAS